MKGHKQNVDGDDNIQIGGDQNGVFLSDSPGSVVAMGNISISGGPTSEEVRQIIQDEIRKGKEKYLSNFQSGDLAKNQNKPDITQSNISILKLFDAQRKLSVPEYQRAFVWKPEHVTKLLMEFVMGKKLKPHIGTMMLCEKSDSYEIVDGGQRVFALTIIFSAIRDYLDEVGRSPEWICKKPSLAEMSSSIHTRLISNIFNGGPLFIPQKKYRDFFARSLHSFPNSDFSKPDSESQQNILSCYEAVLEELRFFDNPPLLFDHLSQTVKSETAITIVKSDSEADLYEVFTSINRKGQPLSKDDIEKTRLAMNRPSWVKEGVLAKSARPGWNFGNRPLTRKALDEWIDQVKEFGIKNIICLLGEEEMGRLEKNLGEGLLDCYRKSGFHVEWIPSRDFDVWNNEREVGEAFQKLEGATLVHCSSGLSRTIKAIDVINARMS